MNRLLFENYDGSKEEGELLKCYTSRSESGVEEGKEGYVGKAPKWFDPSNGLPNKPKCRNLGIFWNNAKHPGKLNADRFAGIMHLRDDKDNLVLQNDWFLCVRPRWGDAVKMLEAILDSDESSDEKAYRLLQPEVKTWKQWSTTDVTKKDSEILYGVICDEPEIPIDKVERGKNTPQMVADIQNFFEIHEYLQQLEMICKRVLKQQSFPVEENLTCRVKGHILVNKQVKVNLSKGRIDRNYCRFNKMTVDTPENRILKYALYLCRKWSSQKGNFLADKIWACENVFKMVPLVRVTVADIHSIKTNSAFKDYKRGLYLAKRIISKMSFAFQGKSEEQLQTVKVRPFFFRMDLLFEMYCRCLLRNVLKELDNRKWMLYGYNQNKRLLFKEDKKAIIGFMKELNADMLIGEKDPKNPNEKRCLAVLDAKYIFLDKGSKNNREHTHQLLSYMLVFDCSIGGFIYPIREKTGVNYQKGKDTSNAQLDVINNLRWGISIGLPDTSREDQEKLIKERICGAYGNYLSSINN